MRLRGIAILVILTASLSFECRRGKASAEDPMDGEATSLLQRYISLDTTNPPGNETRGAAFLAEVLRKEGLEPRLLGSDPQRQSVYARLTAGNGQALILLHHLDVVPAAPRDWTVAPFSGEKSGGYIWGRGALDIKSLGIAQLAAFLELKRSGARLSRDVIFLAVADEEAGGLRGCAELLAKHPELFTGVDAVFNEGGSNETIVDHVSIWGIEVAQKVPLWVRIRARGMPGHGAVPPDDGGAAATLVDILADIRRIPSEYRLVPAVDRYFKAIAPKKPGAKGRVLAAAEKHFSAADFEQTLPASYRSLLRDTLAISRLEAGSNVNSLPAEAIAEIDIRLLPDSDPELALAELKRIVGTRGEVEVMLSGRATEPSPTTHSFYRSVERAMKNVERESIVVPMVSPGTSDSRFFREKGIPAFGISPFKVGYYDADTIHGIDEKIRVRSFVEGVRLTRRIVRDYCVKR
jgi:acetylornithine deacetylase/succinyl-diaminopimelate desuccinylase-like protein